MIKMDKIINTPRYAKLSPLGGIDRLELPESSLRRVAIHCDGALKTGQAKHAGLGFAGGISELAINTLRGHARHGRNRLSGTPLADEINQTQQQLKDIDSAGLINLPATGARIWLQATGEKQLAIQWNIPANIKRNCADLLSGEKMDFVLRLYREHQHAEWKSAHRTLEFPLDIKRRRGFINLEKAGGNFKAEIGVKLAGGRYVFLARSERVQMPLPSNSENIDKLTFSRAPQSGIYLPQVPEIFAAPEIEPVIATGQDKPWLDLKAEAHVAAVYQDFMTQGHRALRCRAKPTPQPLTLRAEQYELRKQQNIARVQSAEVCAVAAKPEFTMERLDKPVVKNTSVRKAVALANPPALIQKEFNSHLVSSDVLPFMQLPYFCRRENLMPVEHFTREELKEAQSKSRRRRIIKVNSNRQLAKVLKNTKLSDKAEIILRGRVKPGRRVRVGGLLIEPEPDGAFCVACVIRNGRLHVPVEEVEAVCCELV